MTRPTTTIACPVCHHRINCFLAATPEDQGEPEPEPDELTLCMYCARWLIVEAGPTLRPLTDAEYAALDTETRARMTDARARYLGSDLPAYMAAQDRASRAGSN